ncbi:polyphosphate polymerase domain-containing protein [Candidatus Saccharibacteria bacterium]|nr:polyphosphate polymerase domain-containing protein [Candidatus Saccharibacteria bacterium]
MNVTGIITKKRQSRVGGKELAGKVYDDRTIERIEEKYLITKEQKSALLKKINKNLKRDEFYKEEVLSIYFDTKNSDLAINSIERPAFREKLRARMYKMTKGKSDVFLEVKSKVVVKNIKLGNKRRLTLSERDFDKFLKGENLTALAEKAHKGDFQQNQIARELAYLFDYYDLAPKVLIAADRVAFKDKDNSEFRLTFDEDLRFREKDLSFKKGSKGEKFFPSTTTPKNCIIMEVKTMNAMPPWFVDELSRLKIYPARFSKYGKIYQLINERTKK